MLITTANIQTLCDALHNFGASTEQVTKAILELTRNMPPITEMDIRMVRLNPSLNWRKRRRIIKIMRKIMKEQEKKDDLY